MAVGSTEATLGNKTSSPCKTLKDNDQHSIFTQVHKQSSGRAEQNYFWHLRPQAFITYDQFSSVQLLSRVRLFATPWIAARQASLSITNS